MNLELSIVSFPANRVVVTLHENLLQAIPSRIDVAPETKVAIAAQISFSKGAFVFVSSFFSPLKHDTTKLFVFVAKLQQAAMI